MSILCSMVGASFTVAAVAQVLRGKKGITAVGNAQVDTAQSKFGGASLLLDGTGDALSTAGIAFGTAAFTVEYWIRPTAQSGYDIHWDLRGTPTSNLSPIVYTLNGTLYVDVGATTVITGSALSNNTWYHIALARSGSSTKLFVNGTQSGSTYTDSNNYVSAATLYIGELYSLGGNGVVGNMDEFRISNSARYTVNFTAPTAPFVNDANTLLLIHADGTDAVTFFEDDNGVRAQRGVTAVGNAQVDTAQSQFGGASALFDGTGDYLTVENIAGGITADQTFEFWIRFADLPGSGGFRMVAGDGGGERYMGLLNDSGTYRWEVSFSSGQYVERFTATVSTNTWYHVALTKSGSTLKVYQGGTQLTSAVSFNTMSSEKTLFVSGTNYIGSWNTSSNFLNGHMDEIRISNNVRYTTGFTPSTTAFVNDANTVLLIHADGTDASTVFRDDNGARSQQGLISNGSAAISTTQSKFGGTSLYLNGTNQFLTSPNASNTAFTTEDFTVEGWIYPISSTGNFVTNLQNGTNNGWQFSHWTTGRLLFCNNSSAGTPGIDVRFSSDNAFTLNAWNHIAVCRTGTTLTMYSNGNRVYSDSAFIATLKASNAGVRIGHSNGIADGLWNDPGAYSNSYSNEIRISNIVRYTGATYTVPTAPFQNDANTLLLIHADGTDASTVFFDDNGIAPYTP